MDRRALDHRDHSRELGTNRYVYAVLSRRARGLSIGVNLNPDAACNFGCPYCQVDRTKARDAAAVDVERLGAELASLLGGLRSGSLWTSAPFDSVPPGLRHAADISFAGDGEPTAAPEFGAAARSVRAIRDREGLAAPLRLLTNATLLDRGAVRAALAEFDELWCKLDAGSDEYFRRVNGTRLPLARVLANLAAVARERPIVVQSLFPTFAGEGPPPREVEAYVARLRELVEAGGTVQRVQVYTVARPPADPHVGALAAERLAEIAARVKELGLPVEVFGGEAETWPPSAGSHA